MYSASQALTHPAYLMLKELNRLLFRIKEKWPDLQKIKLHKQNNKSYHLYNNKTKHLFQVLYFVHRIHFAAEKVTLRTLTASQKTSVNFLKPAVILKKCCFRIQLQGTSGLFTYFPVFSRTSSVLK